MQVANPYQQYKEQSLSTMSPGELLVKLFDELIKQLGVAKINIERGNLGVVNDCLVKSQTIVSTLADSLDMKYDISKELREMYIFLAKQISQANMKKDTKIIEDCIPIVKDLRDSFDQAHKMSRLSTQGRRGN